MADESTKPEFRSQVLSIVESRNFIQRKRKVRDAEPDRLFEQANTDFEVIKRMVIERYQPQWIYQWGSLWDRSLFREYSDIDIVVEGVEDPETFFKMYGDAENHLFPDFPVFRKFTP